MKTIYLFIYMFKYVFAALMYKYYSHFINYVPFKLWCVMYTIKAIEITDTNSNNNNDVTMRRDGNLIIVEFDTKLIKRIKILFQFFFCYFSIPLNIVCDIISFLIYYLLVYYIWKWIY